MKKLLILLLISGFIAQLNAQGLLNRFQLTFSTNLSKDEFFEKLTQGNAIFDCAAGTRQQQLVGRQLIGHVENPLFRTSEIVGAKDICNIYVPLY